MVIFLKTDFIDINCSYILDCRATQTHTHTEISVETAGGSGSSSRTGTARYFLGVIIVVENEF